MNIRDRKKIVDIAMELMKEKHTNFDTLEVGELEKLQDEYIEYACEQKGFTLQEFYTCYNYRWLVSLLRTY